LTYKFDSVDKDLADASNALTGDFKDQFVALTRQTIVPAAKQANIVTSASVAGNSVVKASADSVTVLMFVNQSTTSKDSPSPKLDSSRVRVELEHVGGRWLVSNLQPV
jgi:Mce-associated membrane protein